MAERRIRRALIAVYDKTGVAEFARALVAEFGIEIISTGGTERHLTAVGIPVTRVETITGFPEMLDGRVKTLHPKIHAAILADRDNPVHMRQLSEHGIEPIDMVVVNLYPFEKTVADPNCTMEQAIEMIDIGGPCLLRAAAKNHRQVLVVPDGRCYEEVLAYLRGTPLSRDIRRDLTARTFALTNEYDRRIVDYFQGRVGSINAWRRARTASAIPWVAPHSIELALELICPTKYGENPHQRGAYYGPDEGGIERCFQVAGGFVAGQPSVSFNNYVDADAALALCSELTRSLNRKPRTSHDEPRTSVRAAPTFEETSAPADTADGNTTVTDIAHVLKPPDLRSSAWLLTWTTYGTGVPGEDKGFVSRALRHDGSHSKRNVPGTSYDADCGDPEQAGRDRMKGDVVRLSREQAAVVMESIFEVAAKHHIGLIALSIMEDHAHVLCQGAQDGSTLQKLFKGVSARRLGQTFTRRNSPRWWTEGGSKRCIRRGEDLTKVIDFVCAQWNPLIVRCFDSSRCVGADGGFTAERPEGRGSSAERHGSSACAVFIKHTNACGVGLAEEPIEAYRRAYLGDVNAAMGGILAVNFSVNAEFAEAVMHSLDRWGKVAGAGAFFVEGWVAPSFDDAAVEGIRRAKKWGENVRLIAVGEMNMAPDSDALEYKTVAGGMLVQTPDLLGLNEDQWKVVTKRSPIESEMADLRMAWLIAKHTKSNAISLCKDGMLIGNGAGQMSRVMSCRIATWLARENGHADRLLGAAAASDAFFPFRDGPDILLDAGVTAIIQPGGSKRDEETIRACDEHGAAMIFTGTRHFKH